MNPETLRLGASKKLIEAGEDINIIAILQGEHGTRIQGETVDIYDDDEATREISPETVSMRLSVNDGIDPIPHASVTIGESSSVTGSQGGCTLRDIPVGSQTINVTADGFEDHSETIEVTQEDTDLEITLEEEPLEEE